MCERGGEWRQGQGMLGSAHKKSLKHLFISPACPSIAIISCIKTPFVLKLFTTNQRKFSQIFLSNHIINFCKVQDWSILSLKVRPTMNFQSRCFPSKHKDDTWWALAMLHFNFAPVHYTVQCTRWTWYMMGSATGYTSAHTIRRIILNTDSTQG